MKEADTGAHCFYHCFTQACKKVLQRRTSPSFENCSTQFSRMHNPYSSAYEMLLEVCAPQSFLILEKRLSSISLYLFYSHSGTG